MLFQILALDVCDGEFRRSGAVEGGADGKNSDSGDDGDEDDGDGVRAEEAPVIRLLV